jgi:hypothetical protein
LDKLVPGFYRQDYGQISDGVAILEAKRQSHHEDVLKPMKDMLRLVFEGDMNEMLCSDAESDEACDSCLEVDPVELGATPLHVHIANEHLRMRHNHGKKHDANHLVLKLNQNTFMRDVSLLVDAWYTQWKLSMAQQLQQCLSVLRQHYDLLFSIVEELQMKQPQFHPQDFHLEPLSSGKLPLPQWLLEKETVLYALPCRLLLYVLWFQLKLLHLLFKKVISPTLPWRKDNYSNEIILQETIEEYEQYKACLRVCSVVTKCFDFVLTRDHVMSIVNQIYALGLDEVMEHIKTGADNDMAIAASPMARMLSILVYLDVQQTFKSAKIESLDDAELILNYVFIGIYQAGDGYMQRYRVALKEITDWKL